jgi:hypothetical protein
MPDLIETNADRPQKPRDLLSRVFGSSGLGVGFVLVFLPAAVLMLGLGLGLFDEMRLVGLPMLAIFGIIILFGTLALVAMLFQSLGLTNCDEPLALPQGSIRAAIALSLIVLFAIISIMLFQSMLGSSYVLQGMTKTQRDEMVTKAPERVVEAVPAPCAASVPQGSTCGDADVRFDLRMQGATPPTAAGDLAKQLLVLVGTLMTAVTSFYFAGRGGTDLARKDDTGETKKTDTDGTPAQNLSDTENHIDGCDVPVTDFTADVDLPAARGGVSPAAPGTGA